MKGWLISSRPGSDPGDSTPWFTSIWKSCASYCTSRFGEVRHLSPEQSLMIHAKTRSSRVIGGASPGDRVRMAHRDWYREIFHPVVAARITGAASLAGYRNDAVNLRGWCRVPPRWETARDAVPALFDLLEKETETSVRAVLGHRLFGYIHPFPDGNGRMARFLMNAMLTSGGYPWTVIRLEHRDAYLAALERASVFQDIGPFARFLADQMQWSMERQVQPGFP